MDRILTIDNSEDEKILRQVSKRTTWDEVTELDLINRLREANDKNAWTDGCGLAAIQIGVPLRVAWFRVNGQEEILLNPELDYGIGSYESEEGCLSIPNKKTKVKRLLEIEYWNSGRKKKAKGFKANVIQHEIDHMDGILNIDKEIV